MKIIVSSNCQTSGLTSALRVLLPRAEVTAFPYQGLTEEATSELVARLVLADVWLVTARPTFVESIAHRVNRADLRVVTAPEVYFDAFHPDLVYAWLPEGRTLETVTGPYHSAIALWAWRRGLDIGATLSLFRPEIFEALGYTNRWSFSVDQLLRDFARTPHLDPRDFLLPMQRRGVFMHTVNHPKMAAIAQLSRQIARYLGASVDVLSEPIEDFLFDGLMAGGTVWPVYPSIADSFGLSGSFTWKLPNQHVMRLDEYIRAAFDSYPSRTMSFDCNQLTWPIYDQVLERALTGERP